MNCLHQCLALVTVTTRHCQPWALAASGSLASASSPFYPSQFSTLLTMAAVNNSPITQVSQVQPTHANLQPQLLTRLFLDLRGRRFEVDRDTIMNLPESVLLCLFPNGLVLSRQSVALSDGGDGEEDEEVYGVDVFATYSAGRVAPLNSFLFSLTQIASNMCCRSSGTRQRHSMAPLHRQACTALSNICWMDHPQTSTRRRHRIHCCPNKPLLSFGKSSSTFLSPPRMGLRRPTRMASPTTFCLRSNGGVVTT